MVLNMLFPLFVSLILTLIFGGKVIDFLRKKEGKGQPIRSDGPQRHLECKKGVPTMGGLLIIFTSIISTLIFADLFNPFIIISLLTLIIYGAMGFVDDYIKVTKQTANAMKAKTKLFLQFFVSFLAIVGITYYTNDNIQYALTFPFFKSLSFNLWYFYVPFAMVVVAGSSNAINLTDGLDGLVSGLLIFVLAVFVYLCYNSSILYAKELSVLCMALIGSLLGFLRFNFYPAKIFMGDTGSLALGALMGMLSIMLKSEILFAIIGFVFVFEAISVMIQVSSYKLRGKRFFLMAPIHHHFEQLGWSEKKVVFSFWFVGFVLMILGFVLVML
ncbi:MAG: phospho-N-acetylmuramoyl-pentapeptide-transferase [Alphaproteobacteria bacterium]